jgi:hypothetical protein
MVLRRWHSSSRIPRTPPPGDDGHDGAIVSSDEHDDASLFHGVDEVSKGLHPT